MPKAKQFVTDENGVRVAVMLDIKEYEELLDDLEDLQAVREYEEAKASGEIPIPLEQAIDEIRRNRE
jgi:hypothetical protein